MDVWHPPSQNFHLEEVVQNTCGHTHLRYLRPGPDDTPVHPPPRSEHAKRALNDQPSPAEPVIEHPPLRWGMVSREWPLQVSHERKTCIPHKHRGVAPAALLLGWQCQVVYPECRLRPSPNAEFRRVPLVLP